MSTTELEMKIRELRQLQQLIEEAQAEAEGIRDAIKAHMGEREELRAGEYKITWKPVTSSRLDAAALRKALPEVAACFTRTSTAASAWHRGGVCPQLEILQKGVDLLPVTRYNVARNKEVMGCHPKAGPSISKIVGLNSSLLLWKSNAKKWRRSSGSYKKDRNPKRNGSTKRLMKNSANKNPPRCSSLATGRHGGCTPNTQGLFYPLEAG